MEAKELMVGDLITRNNSNFIITSVDGYGSLIGIDNEKDADLVHVDELKPIPLTKEILEKNPQVEELGYWDERGNLFRLFAMPCINLWSVDRLQKSLRLCGLNDLAYNFKV